MENSGVGFQQEPKMSCFPKCPDRFWVQTVLYHVLREFLLPRAKRPGHEPEHFYSFSAEVNNVCGAIPPRSHMPK